ncbi:MAG: VWA domain-containing protein [Salinivirgaceae bacterium]|nr:VWA domain-containing protein [Salinivirgaceae bacterium]
MNCKKQKRVKRIVRSCKKISIKLIYLFGIFTLLNCSSILKAQDYLISREAGDYDLGAVINETCGAAADETCITLPDINPASGLVFTIPLSTDPQYAGASISQITLDNCAEPSIIINIGTGTIEFPTDATICNGDKIEFTAHAILNDPGPPPVDFEDLVHFTISYQRQAVKLAIVLDISGSMHSPVYNGISYGESRWQVLKNAVSSFLTKYEEVDGPTDLVGLTYFTTDIVPSDPPLGDALISSTGSQAIVYNDMDTRTPLNLTAMGKGLQKAKDDLLGGNNNDNYKKIVLLFTDGMQNVNPLAHTEESTPGNFITYLGPEADNYKLNVAGIAKADSIYYYSIAMNTGAGVPIVLQDLAEKNGGEAYFTSVGVYGTCDPPSAAQDCDLMNDFDQALEKILYGGSPQLLSRDLSHLENGVKTFNLDVNDHISKIIFEIDYNKGDDIKFSKINKGDYNLTNYFDYKFSQDSVFVIASLKLPAKYEKDIISSKGTWDITVKGSSDNNFAFKCFVDDHYFNYTCSTGKNIYTVGDVLEFSTHLSFAGIPLINENNKVNVVLLKPGDDIGHLLATYATPTNQQDSIDPSSLAQQKLNDLLSTDSSFYNALKANDLLIELNSDGKGNYSGDFTETELTGVYQAYFFIYAVHPKFGNFIRTQKHSLVLKFGQLDAEETEMDIDVTPDDKFQTFIVNVKPKNKFGYFIGPGYLSFIKLNIDSVRVKISDKKDSGSLKITDKKDNLDGSYSYTISNVPNDISPDDVQIFIMGEKLADANTCYPLTKWYYIILLVIILIIYLIKKIKSKFLTFLMWFILVVWVIYIILRYLEIICYPFL